FTSGAASVFLLHGVRDVYPYEGAYLPLPVFLHHAFCGDKHAVYYDIASGITFPGPEDEKRFKSVLDVMRLRYSDVPEPAQAYRPEIAIPILEEFLFTRDGAAVIIDYADKLAPREDAPMMTFDERRLATTLRRWAQDPRLQRRNNFVFLLTETLSLVAEELYAQGGAAHVVAIPMADTQQRLDYIKFLLDHPEMLVRNHDAAPRPGEVLGLSPEVLAAQTNGLTRLQVAGLLRTAWRSREKVSTTTVTRGKRAAIEREIGDLVEFTETKLGMEAVAGVDLQKDLLLSTARALRDGKTEVVPKGILLLGPPGCGKTFTMQCFAHDCEIPFLQLKNIFSKYVGSTEANLEKLFHFLDALAPVFVFIDEFDQSYGKRVQGDGDSGVSRRVFAMFNSFLSDDARQGKVLFGAATNRPDLIDPSTLRAGRFDLKLPFLLPETAAREAILDVTFKTMRVPCAGVDLSAFAHKTEGFSGADLKELVRVAQRRAVFAGRDAVGAADLQFALEDYLPPGAARPDEIRLMELSAVTNCTSRSLLPAEYAKKLEDGTLHAELQALQLMVE
ncbi:MAG: ATP-binding protein, partial [Armatimonadetes bacterium]|nr:ATP-binding protein [Armatimonadota bacterium]